MHIILHSSVGVVGSLVFGSPEFFLASVFPDIALIGNEVKLFVKRQKFNPREVDIMTTTLYHLTHSLLMVLLSFPLFGGLVASAILIHQIMDWFSHSGRFETKPLYPICNKSIKQLLKI